MASADHETTTAVPPVFRFARATAATRGTVPTGPEEFLAFLELGPEDRTRLPRIAKRLDRQLPDIVGRFYEHLAQFAAPAVELALVDRPAYEARLTAYVREILKGDFSEAHLSHRIDLGLAHGSHGLPHVWFTGSYRLLERLLGEALRPDAASQEEYLADRRALGKVLTYDLGLVVDAHVQEFTAELDERNRELAERNTELLKQKELRAQSARMLVHDMAGPLSTIITTTEVLAMESIDPIVVWRCLDVLRRNERNLRDMLEDILDVYVGEAEPLGITPRAFDLRALAVEVLDEFDLTDVPEIQAFALDAPPKLPLVWADRRLIERVLRNLVENATHYTDLEGQITVQLRTAVTDDAVVVRVEDSGCGIPPEFRERIFDTLYSAAAAGEPEAHAHRRGTGLGLPFCKAVIEAHGRTILVEDPPDGAGAVFTFSLPIWSGQDTGGASPASET